MQRQIFNTTATRTISTVLNFAIALAVARHLGPGSKGITTLIVTTLTIIQFASNVMGGHSLVYLIPRIEIEKVIRQSYFFSITVSMLSAPVMLILGIMPKTKLLLVSMTGVFYAMSTIHYSLLLGRKKISRANIIMLMPIALQTLGIGIGFYVLNLNSIDTFLYTLLVAHFLTLLISFIVTPIRWDEVIKSKVTINDTLLVLKLGARYQLVELLQLLNLRLYFYILAARQGNAALGVYSIGISILETVWIIPRSISTLQYISTSNSEELSSSYNQTVKLLKHSIISTGILLITIMMVPGEWYAAIFGEGFKDIKHAVRFLSPGIWVYNIVLILSSYFQGTGNYKPLLVSHTVGLFILSIASAAFIPSYYMSGAGLAATLSFSSSAAMIMFYYFRQSQTKVI